MRYSVERPDGSWFEHELESCHDAVGIAKGHHAPCIELAWIEPSGRAGTAVVACGGRHFQDVWKEMKRVRDEHSWWEIVSTHGIDKGKVWGRTAAIDAAKALAEQYQMDHDIQRQGAFSCWIIVKPNGTVVTDD